MTGLPADTARIRTDLAGSVQDIARLFLRRETLIQAAWMANIPVTDIQSLAVAPAARTSDEVIKEYAKQREEEAFAATADLWKLGQVVEDRYGLRWRADWRDRAGRGWGCRSVGLRIFLDGARMAERGPLKVIRQDRVFAGEEAKAARVLGEEEDAAVTVTPVEDPE